MREAKIPSIEITGGGESTLWPAFDQLYENLGLNGIEIGLVTNGSTLSNKRIALIRKYGLWCRISMDAATPKMHKLIHRTANQDFERRIQAIKRLTVNKPKTLTIGISFILGPENYHEIIPAAKLFRDLGVDHLRYSWQYDKEGNAGLTDQLKQECKDDIASVQKTYNTDKFKIFTESDRIDLYKRPNTDFKKCYYQRFVMVIGCDSKVYPCCIQKYHKGYEYADIRDLSLKQITENYNTEKFMDELDVTKCNPCWLRNRNKAIAAVVEQPKHFNFV